MKGYPTLKFLDHGTWTDYTGDRNEDAIVNWVNKRTGLVSLKVDCETMQRRVAGRNTLTMSYFGATESGLLWESFLQSAAIEELSKF